MGNKAFYHCRAFAKLDAKLSPIGAKPINRKSILKKFLFFLIFVAIVLAFDGTLAKDIFDYRIHTLSGWLALVLVLGIFLTLFLAESTKTHSNKNTRE